MSPSLKTKYLLSECCRISSSVCPVAQLIGIEVISVGALFYIFCPPNAKKLAMLFML
jgi:hypothetical protein